MVKTQQIIASSNTGGTVTTANTTQYLPIVAIVALTTGESNVGVKYRSAGTFTNLYFNISANSISGGTSTIRTRKNNSTNGNLTLSVGASATGDFEDITNSDSVTANDTWAIQTVPGAATGTMTLRVAHVDFAATTNTVKRLGFYGGANMATASTSWFQALEGFNNAALTTEANTKTRMRKAATLKNIGVLVVTNRATTSTVRLRKNGANANASISVTGGGATGWYEDTSSSDTVGVGEDWNFSTTTGTGTDNLNIAMWCADLESTNGDGLVMASRPQSPVAFADNTTSFLPLTGSLFNTTAESNQQNKAHTAYDCSEITCLVTANTVTAASTIALRVNAATSALGASVTASTTGVFSDSTDTVTLATSNKVNYGVIVPSVAGTTSITLAWINMVTHITALTRVEKSLTLKWNITGRISKQLTLKWNIIGRISKQLTLKWNILSRISKQLTLKWNILQRVGTYSIKFDGVNDAVDLGDHTDLWSQGLTKFTIGFWIYPTAGGDGNTRDVWRHGTGTTAGDKKIYINSSNPNMIVFDIKDNANVLQQALSTGLVLFRWNHVFATYDNSLGSQNMKIFVDNVVGGTTDSTTDTITRTGQSAQLGGVSNDVAGNIKDIRWWTTKALDSTERTNVINNSPSAPTPDYWIPANEGTGNPVDAILGKTTTFNGATWEARVPSVWTGKILTLKWNIIGRISKQLTLKWNILSRVSKTLTLKWNILSRVSKQLTLKWNIIQRISKQLTLKWNIQQRISKQLTLKWNIIGRISKSLTLKWNILNKVSKQLTLKWNIQQRVSKQLTLKWNILSRVSKQLSLKWNIIGRVSKQLILKWNIIGRISKALTLKWNIQQRISKSLTLKWNILQRVSKQLTLKWNIHNLVSKTLTLKWNIQQRVSKQLTLKWNIIQRVSKQLSLKWDIIGRVSKSLTLKWNIIERVSKQLTLKWNIHQRISKSLTLKWNILQRVSKSLTLLWNIGEGLTRVSKSLTLKWDIHNRVSKTLTLKWDILNRVSKELTLKWNIIARVSKTLTLKWNIIQRVSKQVTLKWHILARVSKQVTLKWNILNLVSKSLTLKWNIIGRVSKTLTLKWNIVARVSKSLTLKWHILNRISKQLTLKWDIRNRVSKSLTLKWNILVRVSKSLTLKWNVDSTLGQIPKHIKTGFTVREKIPRIGSLLRSLYDRTGDDGIIR